MNFEYLRQAFATMSLNIVVKVLSNTLTKHKGPADAVVAERNQNNQTMEYFKTTLKSLKRTIVNSLNFNENVFSC